MNGSKISSLIDDLNDLLIFFFYNLIGTGYTKLKLYGLHFTFFFATKNVFQTKNYFDKEIKSGREQSWSIDRVKKRGDSSKTAQLILQIN